MDRDAEWASETEQEEEDWMDTKWNDPVVSYTCKAGENSADRPCEKAQSSDAVKSCVAVQSRDKAQLMTGIQLNDNKAGMEGLDKEKINKIIFDASKGSKYFENERKKEEQLSRRIKEQSERMKRITDSAIQQAAVEADKLLEELESSRKLDRVIVHVDMDAYYAAVEMRDNPSLRDKPIAVGGNSMLSTSNYHARRFGVRAAMPGFIGKKLCPELIIVKANFKQYTSVSNQVREVMALYDPNFCPMSLDEAYLDFSGHLEKRENMSDGDRTVRCRMCDTSDTNVCLCDLNFYKDADLASGENVLLQSQRQEDLCDGETTLNSQPAEREITPVHNRLEGKSCLQCGNPCPPFEEKVFDRSVEGAVCEMRCRIEQRTRLTASAGIASNMMLAKVCSDKNKPNGQYRIQPTRESIMKFIKDLPIRKIPGIGKVSEKMLNGVGVVTCEDLFHKRALLYHLYSPISFHYFMRICLGMGSTVVDRDGERKSMSTERTFVEINQTADHYKKCSELCQSLASDLQAAELKGRTVTLKLKTVKFEVKTRAVTLPQYTSDFHAIYAAASELLKTEIQNVAPHKLQLRLMGVRMSNLVQQRLSQSVKQDTITGMFKKMVSKPLSVNKSDHGTTLSDKWEDASDFVSESTWTLKENIHTSTRVLTDITTNKTLTAECFQADTSGVGSERDSNLSDGLSMKTATCKHLFNSKHHSAPKNEITTCSASQESVAETVQKDDDRCLQESVDDTLQESVDDTLQEGVADTLQESVADTLQESVDDTLQESVDDTLQESVDDTLQGVDDTLQKDDGRSLQESIADISQDKTLSMEKYECPVCCQSVVCKNLNYFNDHVDICLFKQITATSNSQAILESCTANRGDDENGKSDSADDAENGIIVEDIDSITVSSEKRNSNSSIVCSAAGNSGEHKSSCMKTMTSVLSMKDSSESKRVIPSNTPHVENHSIGTAKPGISDCKTNQSPAADEIVVVPEQSTLAKCDNKRRYSCPSEWEGNTGSGIVFELGDQQLKGCDEDDVVSFFVCPVCNAEKHDWNIVAFNQHVDACLSGTTIKEILQEQEQNHRKSKRSSSDVHSGSSAKKGRRVSSKNTRNIKTYFTA
ncbi:DNA polymerase kappa-like [Gigantopelta aegis]|uniref:DNA polymerase kappa-like n=1 Tax=Gigantopelta aegis TaxID=1735272 RepID=UPI001B88D754|nr:DNA polymerase kappa-like [Gigantopelta aegis]